MGLGLLLLLAVLWIAPRLLEWADGRAGSADPVASPAAAPQEPSDPLASAASREPPEYEVGEVDLPPALTESSRTELSRQMERRYPEAPRRLGIGATVQLRMRVREDGSVDRGSVQAVSSTHPSFVSPTVDAVSRMRFTPARKAGAAVPVWVELPIVWRVDGGDAGP